MPHCKHEIYCVFFCFKGGGSQFIANQSGDGRVAEFLLQGGNEGKNKFTLTSPKVRHCCKRKDKKIQGSL